MNTEEAKRILLAYRPGTPDRDDPEVAEALQVAQHDSTLQRWLDQQTAFQETVRREVRRVAVPAGLREQILAQRKIVTPIWRRPEVLLVAACLALAVILTALWARPARDEESFAGFRSRMVGFALRVYRLNIVTNDLELVREYLRSAGAPADLKLTPALANSPVKGGGKLLWQGNPVAMVCFGLPQTNGTIFMFVADESAFRRGPKPGSNPVLEQVSGMMTAGWSRDGRIYLVAVEAGPGVLKKLVASRTAAQRARSTALTSLISHRPWFLRKVIRNA